jgi:hypothetical protein
MIAIADTVHCLNVKSGKITATGKIFEGPSLWPRATRDYEARQKSGPQFHFASSFFFGTSTITLIAVNLRSESSLASTVTGVSISMSVALIGSLPL